MSSSHSPTDSIHTVLTCIQDKLFHIWQETGYGELTILSDRLNQHKIAITVQSSPHYRYVISDQEVKALSERPSQNVEV